MSKGFWIFAIIGLIIYYIGKFLFRTLKSFGEGVGNVPPHQKRSEKFRPADGNVIVDKEPPGETQKKQDFKGGEYVDYEEV